MVDIRSMTASQTSARLLRWVGGLLLLLGVGIRFNNALRFRPELGFDAVGNLEYLRHLQSSWALPPPESLWSASHPPFFYYSAAALWRSLSAVGMDDSLLSVLAVANSILGLLVVAIVFAFVRKLEPGDGLRSALAAGLILFLPVHLYMSPMVGEEVLLCLLVTEALAYAAWRLPEPPRARDVMGIGLICGLALLTKLSGILVAAAIVLTWALGARARRQWPAAVAPTALLGAAVLCVGGWFYAYNWLTYGYLYPQDLTIHQKMFEFPPGARGILDYVRLPLATFTDPQLLNPDLLHSVWGSTYATIFFDGHRHFLPNSAGASRMGTLILGLALVPTVAFFVGLARAFRRAVAEPGGRDTLLLSMVALTLAGYVVFTWGNPWFVTLKGSYLLGLSLPFAVYASEVLAAWIKRPGPAGKFVALALCGLVTLVVVSFTIGPVFDKQDRGVRKHRQSTPATGFVPGPAQPVVQAQRTLGSGALDSRVRTENTLRGISTSTLILSR